MTDSWLGRLLTQFAVELEISPFVGRNSSHGIAQTMIREGMTEDITHALSDALEGALLDEIHAMPKNMPLEGVYAIASQMFLARGRLELSAPNSGIAALKLDLLGLERPHASRMR
jgi:hypothetical protein